MKSLNWLIIFSLIFSHLHANEFEVRTWTSTVGTTLEAKLLNSSSRSVVLERADGSQLRVKLSQLSRKDRDYVANLPEEKGNTVIAGIPAEPGKISSQINCEGSEWSYHVYLPKGFHDARDWPILFVMSPSGGKNGGALKRYIEASESFGCILAVSVESRNGFKYSGDAIDAMVEDVFERLPVIRDLSFSSGFSGGSRMAYLLAEENRHIKGVIACGSGSGVYLDDGSFRGAELRRSTYVYSLIGTNCSNRTGAYNSHDDFPKDFRLRYFPGGHAWAPGPLLKEAMAKVMGEALKDYRGDDKDELSADYTKAALEMAEGMKDSQPWEAFYMTELLSDFTSDRAIRDRVSSLANSLARNRRVQLAMEAEKDIIRFGREFFLGVYFKSDKGENPSRLKEAERLAEKYGSIPHGELIRRLGEGS
jgi:hypothetical protein